MIKLAQERKDWINLFVTETLQLKDDLGVVAPEYIFKLKIGEHRIIEISGRKRLPGFKLKTSSADFV